MGALASEPPARAKYAAIDIKALCKAGRAEGMRAAIGRLDADLAAISHLTIRGTGGDIGGTTGGLAVARRQVGVMRINCLDCLNRTNLLMSALALRAAAVQLRELAALAVGNVAGEHLSRASEPSLLAALQRMWGEVGDAISIQYAGEPPRARPPIPRVDGSSAAALTSRLTGSRRHGQPRQGDTRGWEAVPRRALARLCGEGEDRCESLRTGAPSGPFWKAPARLAHRHLHTLILPTRCATAGDLPRGRPTGRYREPPHQRRQRCRLQCLQKR
eukprot:scaffold290507_cov27-Tisochrysis_lutea.AAC.2